MDEPSRVRANLDSIAGFGEGGFVDAARLPEVFLLSSYLPD